MFSVPQKYYVPRQITDTYIPRLEVIGLWNLPVEEMIEKKVVPDSVEEFAYWRYRVEHDGSQTFQSEKAYYIHLPCIFECYEQVIKKARAELEVYNQLFNGKEYSMFFKIGTSLEYSAGRMFRRFILLITEFNKQAFIHRSHHCGTCSFLSKPIFSRFTYQISRSRQYNSYQYFALVSYTQRIYDQAFFKDGHSPGLHEN